MGLDERLDEIFRHASWEDGRELHIPERKWEDVIQAIKEAVCAEEGHKDENYENPATSQLDVKCSRCGKINRE